MAPLIYLLTCTWCRHKIYLKKNRLLKTEDGKIYIILCTSDCTNKPHKYIAHAQSTFRCFACEFSTAASSELSWRTRTGLVAAPRALFCRVRASRQRTPADPRTTTRALSSTRACDQQRPRRRRRRTRGAARSSAPTAGTHAKTQLLRKSKNLRPPPSHYKQSPDTFRRCGTAS